MESPGARGRTRQGWVGLAVLAVLAALALLTLLLLALQRGAVTGPSLTLQLGSYALVARTTEHPDCLPLPQQCFIPRPTFRVPQPRYYAVWVGRIQPPHAGRTNGSFALVSGRLMLRLAVAAAP
jgi:hypothetical protein